MAVIRCPNCGKPNPDFLEVCQYCDTRLHPEGVAPPAPPPGPEPISPAPAADDTLVRPPSVGPTPSAPPDTAPAEPRAGPLGWMDRLRRMQSGASNTAPPAARAQADEPDWMWTGKLGNERPTPAPAAPSESPAAPSASVELPEWLRDVDEPIDLGPKTANAAAPATPPSLPSNPPAASTTPSPFSRNVPAAPAEPPTRPATTDRAPLRPGATRPDVAGPGAPAEPSPFEPAASDVTIPPRSRRKMTDWLNRLKDIPPPSAASKPQPPVSSNTEGDLPDWLKAIAAQAEAPGDAAPAIEAATQSPGPAAIPTPEADLPDWLRALRGKTETAANPPGTSAPQNPPPAGTGSLPPARRVQELPPSLRAQAPDDTLIPRPGAKPLEADSDDMPDWLRGILSAQAQEDTGQAEAPAAKADSEPIAPTVDATGLSVAAADSGGTPAAPAASATPTPAMSAAPESASAEPQPALSPTQPPTRPAKRMTDWLGSVPTPAAQPTAPEPADDLPDWLKTLSAESPTSTIGAASAEAPAATPPEPTVVAPTPASPGGTPAAPTPSAEAPAATPAEDLPDWLAAMAPEMEAQPPAANVPVSEHPPYPPAPVEPSLPAMSDNDLPDWLMDLAPEAIGQPPSAVPPVAANSMAGLPPGGGAASIEAPAGPPPNELPEDLPDWLKAITQAPAGQSAAAQAAAAPDATEPAKPIEAMAAQSAAAAPAPTPEEPAAAEPTAVSASEIDLPDWLKAITQAADESAATAAATAAASVPTTETPPAPVTLETAATDVPGLTAAPTEPPAGEAPTAQPAAAEAPAAELPPSEPTVQPTAAAPSAPGVTLPPWLAGVGTGPVPDLPELDEETLAWLAASQKADATPEPAGLELAAGKPPEEPTWLDELEAVTAKPATQPGAAVVPEIAPTPEEDLPDWLRTLRGQAGEEAVAVEAMPDWLRALRGLPPGGTPAGSTSVPAAGQPAGGPATVPAAATATAAQPAPAAPASGLEQAALPAWLAAMRPVDIDLPGATEADSYQETLGVLAGMRGVLRAEPVVAQPHKASAPIHSLAVSDTNTAHANLLAELLRTETAVQPVRRGRVRLSALAERWLIFALLLMALLLTQFQAQLRLPALFAPPSASLSPEAAPVFSTIEGLPAGKPALIAFDYDADQQGELNPGAQAVVAHLARHGTPLVAVSLRLTGAPVAEQVLTQSAAAGFVNLGFMPGGPVGLLQFAADPHSAFQADFAGNTQVWSTGLISNVHSLTDFSLIVLVSGAPESTRTWFEQAQSFAADVPTVAVISAAAEPMVRPYYDAPGAGSVLAGQLPLKGFVVGLGGAAAYERATYSPGAATALWPALGGGLLAAVLIITLGNLFFAIAGALRRRKA